MSKLFLKKGVTLAHEVKAFNFASWKTVERECCGICGSKDSDPLLERDRYGFPVRSRFCNHCGVVYLENHLTSAGYIAFYKLWYGRLVSAYWLQGYGPRRFAHEQRKYARHWLPFVLPYLPKGKIRVLDVGGGLGVVAAWLRAARGGNQRRHTPTTVLDPNRSELLIAVRNHSRIIRAMIETANLKPKAYEFIMMCRTIDHLTDPILALQKLRKALTPKGLLFCDYVQVELTAKRGLTDAILLDHVFNFGYDSFLRLMAFVGFEMVSGEYTNKVEKGWLFRKCAPVKDPWGNSNASELRQHLEAYRDCAPRTSRYEHG